MNRDNGPSTFVKLVIPLAFVGFAVFQLITNRGHVDDNVIGALVFIGVGGTAGYAIDRLIQNLYWARTTGGVDRQHPDPDEPESERYEPTPESRPRRRRKRRPLEPIHADTPDAGPDG